MFKYLVAFLIFACPAMGMSPQPKGTGFVRVVQENGVWWFVDGDGRKFFSIGADCVGGCVGHYENRPIPPEEKKQIVSGLKDWGFNTAGCWSRPSVWKDLYVADQIYSNLDHTGDDMYDEAKWAFVQGMVKREVQDFLRLKTLIGYFLENENGWPGDKVFNFYLKLKPSAPGSRKLVEFLKGYYKGDLGALNRAWERRYKSFEAVAGSKGFEKFSYRMTKDVVEAWKTQVAADYYRRYSAIVRQADPDHLILGIRAAGVDQIGTPEFCKAISESFDVISINDYDRYGNLKPKYGEFYKAAGKPIMITEWSFSGFTEPGHRSLQFIDVYSQKNRGIGYDTFVSNAARQPYMIGMHWFLWDDYDHRYVVKNDYLPDENMGLVSSPDHKPYEEFLKACRKTNAAVNSMHRSAKVTVKEKAPARDGVIRNFTPVLDGDLAEWPAATRMEPVVSSSLLASPRFKHSYRVTHDAKNLYVGMDFTDTHFDFPGKDWAWEGDYLAVYLSPKDPPDDKSHYLSDVFLYPSGDGPKKEMPYAYQWVGPKAGGELKAAHVVRKDRADGSHVIEASVPLDSFEYFPGPKGAAWNLNLRYQNVNEIYELTCDGLMKVE